MHAAPERTHVRVSLVPATVWAGQFRRVRKLGRARGDREQEEKKNEARSGEPPARVPRGAPGLSSFLGSLSAPLRVLRRRHDGLRPLSVLPRPVSRKGIQDQEEAAVFL